MQFIDLQAQYRKYQKDIDKNIREVLDSSRYILGPHIGELESKLAAYVGVKHGIACASGTDALLLGLMAKGVGAGDEIITTPFTFIATVEVISFLGATPVFVDIDPVTYQIDSAKIEKAISNKTKGIIPVSLYGQCADMDAINKIAENNGLFVMEDGAQSFGAKYKGRLSCGLSEIAATSFFPSKPLGCYGDGGMVFTDDDELALKMRQFSNHGQSERYVHARVGLNARLDAIQAAVLLAKWPYFEDEAKNRYQIGKKYNELFAGSNVVTPHIAEYTNRHVFAQYSVRVKNRAYVMETIQSADIPLAVHYPIPIHLQEAYGYLGYKKGDFPVSELTASEIMSLPMHPFLKDEDQQKIVETVKKAVS